LTVNEQPLPFACEVMSCLSQETNFVSYGKISPSNGIFDNDLASPCHLICDDTKPFIFCLKHLLHR